ncbi:MAG TPA: hypothetical protein VFS30_07850 [Dehalococcoidia bacterium]|nr:hypothetical protein [Dehalococcoidia bacterium]
MKPFRVLVLVLLVMAGGFLIACGGDDDEEPAVEDGQMEGMEHMAEPGVVSAKPDDATQVDVRLQEWAIAPGQPSVAAGKVYFLVENAGPDHPHEFVLIRTDLGPLDLPFEADKVPEDQVDLVDEIEEFAPHSSASLTVELEAGKYLLICNITEDDPDIGSHYKKGMVAAFTVE